MAEKVEKVGVKKEKGYLYFVDKKGNVSRAKMVRGGSKKKSSKGKAGFRISASLKARDSVRCLPLTG